MSFDQASKMLKVTGILCIIGGALGILGSILAFAGAGLIGAASAAAGANVIGGAVATLVIVAAIIALAGGVFELITGIFGVKNCANPQKANVCFILGIISTIIAVVSVISSISSGSFSITNLFSLVLPILYTVAAFFVKKAGQSY